MLLQSGFADLDYSHKKRRAQVEYVFQAIKRQFGFTRTRCLGLMKNAAQVNMRRGSPLKMPPMADDEAQTGGIRRQNTAKK
jgi:hypothetical protein